MRVFGWFRKKKSPASLAIAAEYVAAELISYIDGQQKFDGWAHKYRGHFEFDHKAFPTLAHALESLREAVGKLK